MKIALKLIGFTLLIPFIWMLMFAIMSLIANYISPEESTRIGFWIYFILMGSLLTYISEKNK